MMNKIIQLRLPNPPAGDTGIVMEISFSTDQCSDAKKIIKLLPSNKAERVLQMDYEQLTRFIWELQDLQKEMRPKITEAEVKQVNDAIKANFQAWKTWM